MSRFPARHEVPEFTVFASLLWMTAKYGFSDVRDQLIKDVRNAYPTKWEAYQTAEVLGEDVFGFPKPHPNAVLNLFGEQNVGFALPFAGYRACLGGFSALMSDKPGTILPRRTLATTIQGMYLVASYMEHVVRLIAYEENLGVCADRECILSADINPVGQRVKLSKKLRRAMALVKMEPLILEPLACTVCARGIQALYATYGSKCWEQLPSMFSVAQSWGDV
jgi:hypothetical protein